MTRYSQRLTAETPSSVNLISPRLIAEGHQPPWVCQHISHSPYTPQANAWTIMTDSPAPLFASEGSVYKRRPYVTHEEEDEEHVDASLPSTPIDEDGPWSTPQPSEVPLPPVTDKEESGFRPKVEDVAGARQGVKVEEEEPQLRSIDEADSVGGSSRANDERQCRICFGGLEEEDALGKLISPCLCIGSMRVGL